MADWISTRPDNLVRLEQGSHVLSHLGSLFQSYWGSRGTPEPFSVCRNVMVLQCEYTVPCLASSSEIT